MTQTGHGRFGVWQFAALIGALIGISVVGGLAGFGLFWLLLRPML